MKTKHLILALVNVLFFTLVTDAQDPNFEWAKRIGGMSADQAYSITTDTEGNILSTGSFSATVDFDPGVGTVNLTSVGAADIFVQKLDVNGDFLWAKSMGSLAPETGFSITTDASGNVYTTGYFYNTVDFNPGTETNNLTSAGQEDIFIQKLDSDGNFLWAKNIGGGNGDHGRSIATDDMGNVYLTGDFQGTVDFDPGEETTNLTSQGSQDIFVQKLDANGDFLWAVSMGLSAPDQGKSISIDAAGNVYSTGYFYGEVDFDPGSGTSNVAYAGGSDIFIQKLDADGNFLWAKSMGGPENDHASSLAIDAIGNVYSTGEFRGTADFDPGTEVMNLTSTGESDIYVQKLDSNGDFLWAKNMGSTNNDYGNSCTTDANGNIFTTGYFIGTADFDPGTETVNLTSAGSSDIFIQKLDPDGNFVWVKQMGGTDLDIAYSITSDTYGNICTTGSFKGTADFDPNAGTTNLTSSGNDDIFIQKLSECVTTFGTDVITACDSLTWIDGITYTASNNTAMETIMNAGGCDSVVTLNLTINTVSDLTTSLSGATITANNTEATYVWLDCDNENAPIEGETNQAFTPASNGNYAVELTENGCVGVSDCVLVTSVGIIENSFSDDFIVYPNPTKGAFSINFDNMQESLTIRLLSVTGQEIQTKRFQNTDRIQLEMTQPSGIYLLELWDGQNNKAVIRLVKE